MGGRCCRRCFCSDYESIEAEAAAVKLYSQRQNVLDEIVNSEIAYVKQLQKLDEMFIQPLLVEAQKPNAFATTYEINMIFSNAPQLLGFHLSFLTDLTSHKSIAEVFLTLSPFLQMYITYVNAFDDSFKTLESLQANDRTELYNFIDRKRSGGIDLSALLIAPVQRVPRYILLLRELIKYTSETHPDFQPLVEALEKIESIGFKINQSKRAYDNREALLRLNRQSLMQPHRKLLAQCELVVKNRGFFRTGKMWQFYLYSDQILWSSTSKFKGSARFDNVDIEEIDASESDADRTFIMRVRSDKSQKVESFTLIAQSSAAKRDWLNAVVDATAQQALLSAGTPNRSRRGSFVL